MRDCRAQTRCLSLSPPWLALAAHIPPSSSSSSSSNSSNSSNSSSSNSNSSLHFFWNEWLSALDRHPFFVENGDTFAETPTVSSHGPTKPPIPAGMQQQEQEQLVLLQPGDSPKSACNELHPAGSLAVSRPL
ncbi:hypothetical protein ACSSS7_005541 [Eimeria intestinalis]